MKPIEVLRQHQKQHAQGMRYYLTNESTSDGHGEWHKTEAACRSSIKADAEREVSALYGAARVTPERVAVEYRRRLERASIATISEEVKILIFGSNAGGKSATIMDDIKDDLTVADIIFVEKCLRAG